MDEKAERRISEYLDENGRSIDILSDEKLEEFEKVDVAMNDRLNIIRNAAETIKKNQFDVPKIAKISGIPTSTIAQDELLTGYINKYARKSDVTVVDADTMEHLKEKRKGKDPKGNN